MRQNDISSNLNKWNHISSYSRWMYNTYKSFIGLKVLDIGAGIGNMTSYYVNQSNYVVASDIFDTQIEIMNDRFAEFNHFKAIKWDIEEENVNVVGDSEFDTIICINVIEHLENDLLALKKMVQLLAKDGSIIIIAPACPMLYCYLDKNVGHHRRYARGELKRLANELNLKIVKNKYFNLFGVIPYYIKGKVGKDRGGSFSSDLNEKNSKIYNLASKVLEPVENIINPPIGISELIILKKE